MRIILMVLEKLGLLAMIACMSVSATALSHNQYSASGGFLLAGVAALFAAAGVNHFRPE